MQFRLKLLVNLFNSKLSKKLQLISNIKVDKRYPILINPTQNSSTLLPLAPLLNLHIV
jgi:hypothetical protein